MRAEERQRPAAVRHEVADYLGLDPGAGTAVLERVRYPGAKEQYERLDPLENNLPPLPEQIRQVLYATGVIPANTPLPSTVDTMARGLAKGR